MHSHHTVKTETKGWRSNWFVKNVLAEIPIIGAIFHTNNIPHALHNAGKSTAMLVGGTTGMMMDMLIEKGEMESMADSMAKSSINMAAGMMVGNVVYNTLFSLGSTAYEKCCAKSQTPALSSLDASNRSLIQIDETIEAPKSNNTLHYS